MVDFAVFGDVHRPGGATFGVTGGEVAGEFRFSERDRVAIAQDSVGLGRRVTHHLVGIGREIIGAAARQQGSVCFAHHNFCAGELLHQRIATRVIQMGVTVQNDFDVFQAETQLRDAVANARDGGFESGINQNVALGCGDEERTDAGGSDVIKIPDDVEGLEGRVPGFPFLADGGVFGGVLCGVIALFVGK